MEGQIIEIFGKRLKVVADNDDECTNCALKKECNDMSRAWPCKKSDGSFNQHFEEV